MFSAKKLHAQGKISTKAYNALLAQTKPQNSKMAAFDGKSKDEARAHGRGEVPTNEINHPTNQKLGSPRNAGGAPSRGGQARGGAAPTSGEINQAKMQAKKFPKGGKYAGKGNKTGPAGHIGVKGGVVQSGPMYGGGGRGTQ